MARAKRKPFIQVLSSGTRLVTHYYSSLRAAQAAWRRVRNKHPDAGVWQIDPHTYALGWREEARENPNMPRWIRTEAVRLVRDAKGVVRAMQLKVRKGLNNPKETRQGFLVSPGNRLHATYRDAVKDALSTSKLYGSATVTQLPQWANLAFFRHGKRVSKSQERQLLGLGRARLGNPRWRDPFARETLVSRLVPAGGETCAWCGNTVYRKGQPTGKLYEFTVERDAGQDYTDPKLFCSRSCRDTYYGD